VNKHKFIHVLLIALVCYSQLAATFHMAEHLHVQKIVPETQVGIQGHHLHDHAAHGHGHSVEHLHHRSVADSNEAERDCALYHAIANLSGIFTATQATSLSLTSHTTPPALSTGQLADSSFNNQRIRAPPRYS